jgi:short-subunit dehydrogenase
MSTALITGASSGIGRELARIHARRGGDVVAVARSADTLAALRDELQGAHGVTVHVVPSDLSQPGAGARVHDEVVAAGIDVDVLINNAGFGGRGRFDQRDWADDLAMIHVNVVALTELTRMFVPAMVARNRGRILNVSSTAAVVPGPLQAVYYATKAYVTSFSNAVAGELHDSAVTVTTPMPGVTDTGFAATSGMADTVHGRGGRAGRLRRHGGRQAQRVRGRHCGPARPAARRAGAAHRSAHGPGPPPGGPLGVTGRRA